MPQYKLHYFNTRGLAELPRLIMHYGGIQFEDVRFERDQWPSIKPSMPFGHVPVLEVDGKMLSQSSAISRYLARQVGLNGQNEWEDALVDMYADAVKDLMMRGRATFMETDPEKQKEMAQKYVTETLNPHLVIIEAQLEQNSGVLVGKDITWADLACYAFFSNVTTKFPDVLKQAPKLRILMERIENADNIKKYLAERLETEM